MLYVPYKGTGQLMPDLLNGRLQAGIDNVAVMTPYIKRGALRALAVTGETRSPLLPDIPTMAEAGIPGFRVIGWFGIFAPAKTPKTIVHALNESIVEIIKQPDFRGRLLELGAEPETGGDAKLGELLASEMRFWGKVIADAGIKLE
jgi:tripartite-type tricarboxylate transporter receptor subunit TctC